jgi:methylenetetrahydrofolate dehydrogenase (NADP+)/methenyltetrahydrofolate cyclohydrolase
MEKKHPKKIKHDLALLASALKNKNLRQPHLTAILVGSNGASETYVASKIKSCAEIGFQSSLLRFDADIPRENYWLPLKSSTGTIQRTAF